MRDLIFFNTTCVVALVIVVLLGMGLPDSTDKSFWKRSGMTLSIDHETGCEYLSKSFKTMIPRLDENGKHICRKNGGAE